VSQPKEMGKPVADLTHDELRREQHRCRTLIQVNGSSVAAKGLRKRLIEINKRLQRELDG
jgi:hypothetical protein